MEFPGGWNLLTSSLTVSDLRNPEETWKFLVAQGLVRDQGHNRTTFVTLVEQERQAPPRPGPSLTYRLAESLYELGLATWFGRLPDPWGILARPRRWLWRKSRNSQ
jgi:hypothetical protein